MGDVGHHENQRTARHASMIKPQGGALQPTQNNYINPATTNKKVITVNRGLRPSTS